jgi:hypothetical protein
MRIQPPGSELGEAAAQGKPHAQTYTIRTRRRRPIAGDARLHDPGRAQKLVWHPSLGRLRRACFLARGGGRSVCNTGLRSPILERCAGLRRWGGMEDKVYDEPTTVDAEDGNVVLDGPDGVAVLMTPEAAMETSDRLLFGAAKARGQQIQEEARHQPHG